MLTTDKTRYLNMPDTLWKNIYWDHNNVDSRHFYGSVLYLGMGSCFLPRHQSTEVTKTVIVELDLEVIQYNKQSNNLNKDWVVISKDAYKYTPDELFDFIVVDIWYDVQENDIVQSLVNRYRPWTKSDGKTIWLLTVASVTEEI